jgi:hypothetical protein
MIPEPLPVVMRASICRIIALIPFRLSGLFAKLDFPLNVERPSWPCGGRWQSAIVPEQPAHISCASR